MKLKFFVAAVVGCGVITLSALETRSLDGLWDFAFRENAKLDGVTPGFTVTDKMPVPGCFDLMPRWYARRGTGLYRRTFDLDVTVQNAYLRVKGMGLKARFFIDGRKTETVKYPFSTFEVELGSLTAGRHTLEAAVDNILEKDPSFIFQPYYDFFASGGFYHGVELKLQKEKHELDRVLVRTRDIATGRIELELVFRGGAPAASVTADVCFDAVAPRTVTFVNNRAVMTVPSFRLWSCSSPALHRVRVVVPGSGSASARFGIREMKAHAKKFWLNGKEIFLKGVNRHDADPENGYATDRKTMYRDLTLLKSIGGNYIRGSHYPQTDEFLDLCDEMGILVWEESLGWGNHAELDNPEFIRLQLGQTALMVRNTINHPSVVINGFLNEFRSDRKQGQALADRLITVLREADTGHLITFACNHPLNDICNARTDFISFNQYPSWHGDQGKGSTPESLKAAIENCFSNVVATLRRKYGEDKPIIVGETGVYAIYGNHDVMGAQWTEEFQSEYLADWLTCVFASPEMAGFTVWQFADSRTFFRGGGDIRTKPFGYNFAGLFDGRRRPKLAAETVRSFYRTR